MSTSSNSGILAATYNITMQTIQYGVAILPCAAIIGISHSILQHAVQTDKPWLIATTLPLNVLRSETLVWKGWEGVSYDDLMLEAAERDNIFTKALILNFTPIEEIKNFLSLKAGTMHDILLNLLPKGVWDHAVLRDKVLIALEATANTDINSILRIANSEGAADDIAYHTELVSKANAASTIMRGSSSSSSHEEWDKKQGRVAAAELKKFTTKSAAKADALLASEQMNKKWTLLSSSVEGCGAVLMNIAAQRKELSYVLGREILPDHWLLVYSVGSMLMLGAISATTQGPELTLGLATKILGLTAFNSVTYYVQENIANFLPIQPEITKNTPDSEKSIEQFLYNYGIHMVATILFPIVTNVVMAASGAPALVALIGMWPTIGIATLGTVLCYSDMYWDFAKTEYNNTISTIQLAAGLGAAASIFKYTSNTLPIKMQLPGLTSAVVLSLSTALSVGVKAHQLTGTMTTILFNAIDDTALAPGIRYIEDALEYVYKVGRAPFQGISALANSFFSEEIPSPDTHHEL